MNKNQLLKSLSLPILSGILIGTSYIPFPPWAILFCFVPLWTHWLKCRSVKAIFWSGWITQFVLATIGFNWIAHTAHEFGHLPWPISILVMCAFCSFANLHIPIAGVIWFAIKQNLNLQKIQTLILLPALTSVAEMFFPMIFDWNFGYPWLWANLPGFHVADVIGMQGLSTFTIFINVFFLIAWRHRSSKKYALQGLGVAFMLFATINLWGWAKSTYLPKPDAEVTAMSVQANIGNLEKQFALKGQNFRSAVINKFFELTQEGLKKAPADFAVWPETAFPYRIRPDLPEQSLTRRLSDFLEKNNLALITGSYGVHPESLKVTNSMFFFDNQGHITAEPYHKTILLAFGEFFPGAEWFPALKKLVPAISDFGRGFGPEVRNFLGLAVGPQICYESLYPAFTRSLANQGAELIVNITNDSWFGTWAEPYQHLYMTLGRAIEFRRPLLRVTNTGISTAILASGEVLERSPLHQESVNHLKIAYLKNPPATFFQKYGIWLIPAIVMMLVFFLIGIGLNAKFKQP